MAETIHLKWYHTFVFLFQSILSVADVVTDILTCASYYKEEQTKSQFFIALALIILPMIVTCIWSIVASTSRTLDNDIEEPKQQEKVDLFFRSTLLNVFLSCSCVGPTLHSLELFLFCARNIHTLWNTKGGVEVKKDDGCLYYLYIHNMNLKLVEGLLESGPQLFLQLFVMVRTTKQKPDMLNPLHAVSISISFLSLTYTITSSEVFREYSGRQTKLWQVIVIFIVNVGLMAGRAGAFVFFAATLRWWLSLIITVHWLTAVLMGFALWNSKRVQHLLKFFFCHSLSSIFVFRASTFGNIRDSNKPMCQATEYFITIVWYFAFAVENSAMILTYYTRNQDTQTHCLDLIVLAVVLGGTYGGILVKVVLWCCCFRQPCSTEDDIGISRPATILVRDQGVCVRTTDHTPQL